MTLRVYAKRAQSALSGSLWDEKSRRRRSLPPPPRLVSEEANCSTDSSTKTGQFCVSNTEVPKMILLSVALAMGCVVAAPTYDGKVSLKDARTDGNVVSMQIALHLVKEQAIYSWHGFIYPLLGYGLQVNAVSSSTGERLTVENDKTAIPVLPHEHDFVRAQDYEYPERLRLVIHRVDGSAVTGCARLTVEYNTTRMKVLGPLDRIRLEPASVVVCFGASPTSEGGV